MLVKLYKYYRSTLEAVLVHESIIGALAGTNEYYRSTREAALI